MTVSLVCSISLTISKKIVTDTNVKKEWSLQNPRAHQKESQQMGCKRKWTWFFIFVRSNINNWNTWGPQNYMQKGLLLVVVSFPAWTMGAEFWVLKKCFEGFGFFFYFKVAGLYWGTCQNRLLRGDPNFKKLNCILFLFLNLARLYSCIILIAFICLYH